MKTMVWVVWISGLLLQLSAEEAAFPELGSQLEDLSQKPWTANSFNQITATLLNTSDWKFSSETLSLWLNQHYNPRIVSTLQWRQISGLQKWSEALGAFPEITSKLDPKTIEWFLNDPSLTWDLFANLTYEDKLPAVLGILEEAHKAAPSKFPAYNRLAIAMAVVWDVPPPICPHSQADPSKVPTDQSTTLDRFHFWVDSNDKHLTDFDLTKLEVEQLKFIVDAAVALDELRWARQSVRFNRGNFDRAFFAVPYDEPRLNREEYTWPHPVYSLQEIRKRGGICVDQAYFAAIAGKANGIPTLFFTGQGRRGGHAWFGFMSSPDRWLMDCGRYQYDKYASGMARNPQTGLLISDHEIAFLAEPFRNSIEYQTSMIHLRQARLFLAAKDIKRALEAADNALALSAKNIDAWNFKSTLLEVDPESLAAYKTHLNAMMTQFLRYPDIKTECQEKIAALARKSGDEKEAARIEDRMIRENRNKRQDLSAEVYHKQLIEACEKSDWKTGRAVVHDAVMKLKDETGTVFTLLNTFVQRCLMASQPEEASRAIGDFKGRMQLDSIMARKLEDLNTQVKKSIKERVR